MLLIVLTGGEVVGQGTADGQSGAREQPLRFRTTTGDIARAGNASLTWWPHPEADAYRLRDEDRNLLYQGRFTRAFVSGLPDGEQRFWVSAIDAQGNEIAQGPEPAVVVVQHWPAELAWGLFAIGAVVVGCLVAVLIAGAMLARPGGRETAPPAGGAPIDGPGSSAGAAL